MSKANRHDIHVLNALIQATIDAADGYREAAHETADPNCRELFGRRSFERRRVADDLGSSVRALGGRPDTQGSLIAKAQRAFTDIRHALLRDAAGIVGAVDGVEDTVRVRFERALKDSQISAATRETIRRAFASVRDGHDRMAA